MDTFKTLPQYLSGNIIPACYLDTSSIKDDPSDKLSNYCSIALINF